MPYDTISRDQLLVETEWLARHLVDPGLRIIDIRGVIRPPDAPKPWYLPQREAYLAEHVPGAVFVDWTTDITESDPDHLTLAGPERFRALMERLGIGDETEVIVYDDAANIAPRLWWALNYYGHSRVRLLNGGWTKWKAEGRPVDARVPTPARAAFTLRIQEGWRVSTPEVREAIDRSTTTLLDCRSPREFRGEISRGARKGHIPSARSLPAVKLLDGGHKTWRDVSEIRQMYEAVGVSPDVPVITYCNAGVSAAVGLFGLKLAGHPRAANFAGSWYEWERQPANPVVTGE